MFEIMKQNTAQKLKLYQTIVLEILNLDPYFKREFQAVLEFLPS